VFLVVRFATCPSTVHRRRNEGKCRQPGKSSAPRSARALASGCREMSGGAASSQLSASKRVRTLESDDDAHDATRSSSSRASEGALSQLETQQQHHKRSRTVTARPGLENHSPDEADESDDDVSQEGALVEDEDHQVCCARRRRACGETECTPAGRVGLGWRCSLLHHVYLRDISAQLVQFLPDISLEFALFPSPRALSFCLHF